MINKQFSPRVNVTELLYFIQVLYQNGEINTQQKNELTKQVRGSINGGYEELTQSFENLKYLVTYHGDIVDKCLKITKGLA